MDRWWHHTRRLRVRLGVFLVGGILVTAVAFYALLLTVTRAWLERELTERSLGVMREIVRSAALPMLAHDPARIHDELQTVLHEDDVVGVTAFDADGLVLARFVRQPVLWRQAAWPAPRVTLEAGVVWRRRRVGNFELRSVSMAVDPGLAGQAHGPVPPMPDGPAYPGSTGIGAVQLLISTQRLEHSMGFAARLGFALLALALALALAGAWSLIRLVTRPLREASDLARAIANGQLDRRLPVR
ncbi:MAG: HAMP domain-containing protein, partial [Candidatus Eisenbacteria bacterium]